MNKLVSVAIAAFLGAVGFLSGQYLGQSQTLPSAPAAAASPAPANPADSASHISKPAAAAAEDAAAWSKAMLILVQPGEYRQSADFHEAIQHLSLPQMRELHLRVRGVSENPYFLEMVADRLAALDPAAAADYVRAFSTGANVKDNTGLLHAWARQAPEEAIAEAAKAPASSKARLLLGGAFATLSETDPVGAVSRLNLIADAKQRNEVLDVCLKTWARNDPVAAAEWVTANPGSYAVGTRGNQTIAKFAKEVATRDVEVALAFGAKLTGPVREQALVAAAAEWAMQDPMAALSWCRENSVTMDRPLMESGSCVMCCAVVRGPAKTLAWLQGLSDGGERTTLVGEALTVAKADIAKDLFALVPAEDQPGYVGKLMKSLNNQRTGGALTWAASLPEGELRMAALTELIDDYHFTNPVGTIDQFAPGRSRDAAYAAHILKDLRTASAPDLASLSKIADPGIRQQTAANAFRHWYNKDPAAAQKWLSTTTELPETWKARTRRD